MSQESIIKRADELMECITAARHQIEHFQIDLRHLQAQCKHPNKYGISTMGERGTHCPDCRWTS